MKSKSYLSASCILHLHVDHDRSDIHSRRDHHIFQYIKNDSVECVGMFVSSCLENYYFGRSVPSGSTHTVCVQVKVHSGGFHRPSHPRLTCVE